MHYYYNNNTLKKVIDLIETGFFSPENPQLFTSLIDSLKYEEEA